MQLPEHTLGDSTERVITIPAISPEGTTPVEKRWKLKEKKVEEFKLADGTVWTTAETVNAQLNVRTGKGIDFDVAGRIRKGEAFFSFWMTERKGNGSSSKRRMRGTMS